MGIVMDMSSYEIERDPLDVEYSEEVMCSGWNPAINLMCQQVMVGSASSKSSMPAELAMVDAELFLQKMYACQR
ncbi:MAG: hypothetical protein OEV35_05645 [Gallionellaceae bacterium]|nr:hypothetical protein [Gallionellaceae bacterium]